MKDITHFYDHTEVFIGGEADGRRITIPAGHYPYYKVHAEPEVKACAHIADMPFEYEIKIDTYRRDRLVSDGHVFELYVLDSLTPSQAIHKLINRYKRP